MENQEEDPIVKEMDKVKDIVEAKSPAGYLQIQLSSKGKFGAPKVFHVKNFSTEDLVHLAVSDETELPERTVEFLNGIIYEDGVDVGNFHEKEVIETLLILFRAYYSPNLKGMQWEVTDDDRQYLRDKYGENSDECKAKLRALEKGTWKPVYDINLDKVEMYDLDPNEMKTTATIKNSRTGFTCTYSWPKYGDILKVKKYTDEVFKEKDKRFQRLQKIVRFRRDAEDKLMDGGDVDISRVPDIPENERKELREYEEEKLNFMTVCMRAMQLVSIRGEDISSLTLAQRIPYARDPELDFSTFKSIQAAFGEKLLIGPKEEMTVFNPVKQMPEKRKITFRILEIISAIKDTEPDGLDISFE